MNVVGADTSIVELGPVVVNRYCAVRSEFRDGAILRENPKSAGASGGKVGDCASPASGLAQAEKLTWS